MEDLKRIKYLEYQKKYRLDNKEKHKLQCKKWVSNNKEKVKKYKKQYEKDNKEKIIKYQKEYCSNRRKNDINYNLCKLVRTRIYSAFKSSDWIKKDNTESLLGGDIKTVKNHIESLFKDGMNWSNQGEWHIDHILPIGNCRTNEEIITRCHYKNLQPLWAIDNLIKGSKMDMIEI